MCTIWKMRRQTINWGKIFSIHLCNKGFSATEGQKTSRTGLVTPSSVLHCPSGTSWSGPKGSQLAKLRRGLRVPAAKSHWSIKGRVWSWDNSWGCSTDIHKTMGHPECDSVLGSGKEAQYNYIRYYDTYIINWILLCSVFPTVCE